MKEQTDKMQWQKVKNQYFAAAVVNLATIGFGLFEGWSSPSILLLTSAKSPLPSGTISMEQASWVASLQCVGCLLGNICFGYIINRYGRRLPLIILAFPLALSWLLVLFSQDLFYLYASRVIGGFFSGGGGYIIVPLFICEISDDRIRGFLTSTQVLTENVGMLMGYVIGAFFDFSAIPIVGITIAILSAILIYLLPETPIFLVKQNRMEEAETSIRFYQNIHKSDGDRKIIEVEINRLNNIINDISVESNKTSFDWSELRTKVAQKALLIGIVLMALNQFSGVVGMLSYTANIFADAGSSLEPNIATIVIGIMQLVANVFATNLVDRAGRKLLIALSSMAMALGLAVLGVYMNLKSWDVDVTAFSWLPLVSFSFVVFVSQIGVLSLPFIVLAEIMPERIKDGCVSFCMSLLWTFSFIIIKYLPMLMELLGFHGSMYLFAGICIAGAAFVVTVMPETKCKTHEEIMKSLE